MDSRPSPLGATRPTASSEPVDVIPQIPRPRLSDERRHRIDEWRFRLTDPRLGALVLAVVALGAGVFWYVTGVRADEGPVGPPGVAASSGSSASDPGGGADVEEAEGDGGPAVLVVHVAGAVVEPGVVELVDGSRIIDALDAVGGARPDGDLDQLNLAAPLNDGQRVLVPVLGQPLPATPAGVSDPGAGGDGALLDLNTATTTQLEELPGIGPTLADAIVTDREKRGGYRAVEDLRGVSGIGEKRFADIRDLVTVP